MPRILIASIVLLLAAPAGAATYINAGDGNFATLATWATVDSSSFVDSEQTTYAVTTSYAGSSGSPSQTGGLTVDGHALKVSSRASAGSANTFSTELYQNGVAPGSVAGTEVVVNVVDLPTSGWVFFKYAAPVVLKASPYYYTVRAKASAVSQVVLFRSSATGTTNYSKMLRTTTAAPSLSAGDDFFVLGELTGAGLGTNRVVTMDNTAATVFGSGPLNAEVLGIGHRGTLAWGTAAATNYKLNLAGILKIGNGGTMTMGTAAAPVPATSTAELAFANAVLSDYGLHNVAGTLQAHGALKRGWTQLAADAAASATTLTVDSTRGWSNGDYLALAATTYATISGRLQVDTTYVSSVDSDTQVTVSPGLTYAHSGASTGSIRGAVGNLTRNIKIHGASMALPGWIYIQGDGSNYLKYVDIYNMGTATTAGRSAIYVATGNGGSTLVEGCSIRDTGSAGPGVTWDGANLVNATLRGSVIFDTGGACFRTVVGISATSLLVDDCMLCYSYGASAGIIAMSDVGAALKDTHVTSCATQAMNIYELGYPFGGMDGCSMYACTGVFAMIAHARATYNNCVVARSGYGFKFANISDTSITNCSFDGCGTYGFSLSDNCSNVYVGNCRINGETGFTTQYGMAFGYGSVGESLSITAVTVDSCAFGRTDGYRKAITSGDVLITASVARTLIGTRFNDCLFGGAPQVAGLGNMMDGSFLAVQNDDQTVDSHVTYMPYGKLTRDTLIASPANMPSASLRMTPSSTAGYLKSRYGDEGRSVGMGRWSCAVDAGGTTRVSVKVRCSAAGDGAAYNGQRPRLWLERNYAAGMTSSTLLATATAASDGAWETLTAATPVFAEDAVLTFYVDCGSTGWTRGWVNVDDFQASPHNSKGFKYWGFGAPFVHGNNRGDQSTISAGP